MAKIVNYFRKKKDSLRLVTIATKKLIRRLIFSIKIEYNAIIAYVAPFLKLFEM